MLKGTGSLLKIQYDHTRNITPHHVHVKHEIHKKLQFDIFCCFESLLILVPTKIFKSSSIGLTDQYLLYLL